MAARAARGCRARRRRRRRLPSAPVRTVTDTYFGTSVPDPYRYLEDMKSPDVAAWMKAQADFTRATLDRIPGRAALARRIGELGDAVPARVSGVQVNGTHYYYLKRLAAENVRQAVRACGSQRQGAPADRSAGRDARPRRALRDRLLRTVFRQQVRRLRHLARRLRRKRAARDRGRHRQGNRRGDRPRAVRTALLDRRQQAHLQPPARSSRRTRRGRTSTSGAARTFTRSAATPSGIARFWARVSCPTWRSTRWPRRSYSRRPERRT